MGNQNVSLSHARDKTKKHLSQFFIELKTYQLYYLYQKHYTIDIADPSSMQDACYKNFVIGPLTEESLWLSGRASECKSEGLRFDSP